MTSQFVLQLTLSICFKLLFCINASMYLLTNTNTHTHPFNGPFSGTTRVSRYHSCRPTNSVKALKATNELHMYIVGGKRSTSLCMLHIILQPFNGLFSRTTWVSRYQKCKTKLDFTDARVSEWQWHQLGHMQVCP